MKTINLYPGEGLDLDFEFGRDVSTWTIGGELLAGGISVATLSVTRPTITSARVTTTGPQSRAVEGRQVIVRCNATDPTRPTVPVVEEVRVNVALESSSTPLPAVVNAHVTGTILVDGAATFVGPVTVGGVLTATSLDADVSLSPVLATGTVLAATSGDRAARELWLEDFGDAGSGDWTTILNAVLAHLTANGGGTLKLRNRLYGFGSQIIIPSTASAQDVYVAPNIRIIGQGHSGGAWQQGFPTTGTRLDLQYNGAGGGRIFSPGAGTLLFEGVSFCDGGASPNSTPFLLNTNAKMRVKECSFRGDEYGGMPTAIQLAGATVAPGIQGMLPTSPFQGYGTTIRGCMFDRINRALHARVWAAGVVFDSNVVWQACGGEAPIEIESNVSNNAYQNVITNNYMEIPAYKYGVKLTAYVSGTFVAGNGWYDIGVYGPGLLSLYYFGTSCRNNFIIENGASAGLDLTPVATGPDAALNTILNADGGHASSFCSSLAALRELVVSGYTSRIVLDDAAGANHIHMYGDHLNKAVGFRWDDGGGAVEMFRAAQTSATRVDLTLNGSASSHLVGLAALNVKAAAGSILDLGNVTYPQALRVLSDGNLSAAGQLLVGRVSTNRIFLTGQPAITYSASMTPDASLGTFFTIGATDGTAFTINAPTNGTGGQQITIMIFNQSGGALGAVTWNAAFKLSAWTQPANGTNRSVTFINLSGAWREVSRTPVDVST
jgi:hypothetical protein